MINKILVFLLLTLFGFDCFSQTQLEMNENASLELKNADKELNRVYKQIMYEYKFDSLFTENLKKSQRIWITFRDAELEMKFPTNKNRIGSLEPMCKALYLTELTNQRTTTLKKWLISESENDACNGSIRAWEINPSETTARLNVDKKGEISFYASMELDHRIFGYEKPDKSSSKLILISIFTNDVENNPFNCKYGAYYEISGISGIKGFNFFYKSTIGDFVEVSLQQNGKEIDKVYMDKRWFHFE